jgi:hypothetical protein
LAALTPYLALYIDGMGTEGINFHAELYRRMGYSALVDEVTALLRSDRQDQATAIIPDELVEDAAIIGDVACVREQVAVWEAAGVTMMLVSACTPGQVRELAAALSTSAPAAAGPDKLTTPW